MKKLTTTTLTVHINDDPLGGIYIDRDPIHVDKNTEIEWEYVGANASGFTILFANDSPFAQKVYHSKAKKANSKAPNASAVKGMTYKYFVLADNDAVIDPGVIVH